MRRCIMRKLSLIGNLLSCLLILGCGSGGDVVTGTGDIQKEEQYGKVAFHIQLDNTEQLDGPAKRLYRIPANTTGILVRAWDDAGHDVLTEIPISQGTSTLDTEILLPVGTSYRLDAVAYNKTTYKSILTVGQSDPFAILANTTVYVSLTLNSYLIDFSGTTTEVTGGEPLTIQVTITGPDFHTLSGNSVSSAYLYAALEAWTQDGVAPYPGVVSGLSASSRSKLANADGTVTYTLLFTTNAPVVSITQPLYYQISFWTNNKYRTDNIPFLYLSSLAAGESLGIITVNPPTGGVIVNMN